jgi:hypothetical protein
VSTPPATALQTARLRRQQSKWTKNHRPCHPLLLLLLLRLSGLSWDSICGSSVSPVIALPFIRSEPSNAMKPITVITSLRKLEVLQAIEPQAGDFEIGGRSSSKNATSKSYPVRGPRLAACRFLHLDGQYWPSDNPALLSHLPATAGAGHVACAGHLTNPRTEVFQRRGPLHFRAGTKPERMPV